MMKKLLLMAACVLAMVACKKEGGDEPGPAQEQSIAGIWELTSVATKAAVGDVQVSVYIEFTNNGNFTLYQKIGEGRYTKFTGTYVLSSDGKLSGAYSTLTNWGPYDVSLNGDTLALTSAGGKEVDTYKKIASIPENVINNIY